MLVNFPAPPGNTAKLKCFGQLMKEGLSSIGVMVSETNQPEYYRLKFASFDKLNRFFTNFFLPVPIEENEASICSHEKCPFVVKFAIESSPISISDIDIMEIIQKKSNQIGLGNEYIPDSGIYSLFLPNFKVCLVLFLELIQQLFHIPIK